ncbi:AAWKG family protein [Streptomyces sp. NPDC060031]|uniref:AAWKG family protein n=1 Tax=Streptomyces sp. NPDC060031 TaxID=3347043 RepID=UPI0036A78BC4
MAEQFTGNQDAWEGAVKLLTGFSGPTREEVFKIYGSPEVPWMKVSITKGTPSTVGPGAGGHAYVLAYCSEPDGVWSKYDSYNIHTITIDYPFSGDGGKHFGDAGMAGVFNHGYGHALETLIGNTHTTKGFTSGDYKVSPGNEVDVLSFERTAKAFDRAGVFFKNQAAVLAEWSKSLGEPDAIWQGNAAGLFRHLIDDLDTAYQGYDKQLHPAGWTASGAGTGGYTSTTQYGDSLIKAQTALVTCAKGMYDLWGKWIANVKAKDGTTKVHYLQTLTANYLLDEIQAWTEANNYKQVNAEYFYSSEGGGTTIYTSTTAFKSASPWGDLSQMATWTSIANKAVDRWTANVKESLDAPMAFLIRDLNDVWQRVISGTSGTAGAFKPATIGSLTADMENDKKQKETEDKKNEAENKKKEMEEKQKEMEDKKGPGGGGPVPPPGSGPGSIKKNVGDGINRNPPGGIGGPPVKNPDGSITTRNPDGSTTTRKPDGTVVTTYPNGRQTVTGPVRIPIPNPLIPGGGGPGGGPRSVKNPDGSITSYNPSDGSRSTKFPDGTTTTIDKDGTTTTANPDGSTTVLHKDGSETVTYPDGTRTTITKDGTSTTHFQDGSSTTYSKDGKLVTTDASGHSTVTRPAPGTVVHNPDGGTTTFNADGSATSTHINGTKTTVDPHKGIVTTTDPDGTRTVSDLRDGTSTIRYADGSTAEVGKDGKVTTHYKDGSSSVLEPDGTLTAKDSSGSPSTTRLGDPDGGSQGGGPTVRHGSDGSTTTTYPDGTVTKKLADGTVTTTYRDGSTYSTAPDGRVTTTQPLVNRITQNPLGTDRFGGPVPSTLGLGSYSSGPVPAANISAQRLSGSLAEPGTLPTGRTVATGSAGSRAAGSLAAAEQAALAAGARPATTSTGQGGMPMMPPGGGAGGAPGAGTQSDERERVTWLSADEDVWGTDEGGAPAVIGR